MTVITRCGVASSIVEDDPGEVAITLRAPHKEGMTAAVTLAGDGHEAFDHQHCQGEHGACDPGDCGAGGHVRKSAAVDRFCEVGGRLGTDWPTLDEAPSAPV